MFLGSTPNCVGDLADLRCVSLPGAEPPGSVFTLTSRRFFYPAGGLIPASVSRVSALHIQPTTPHQRGKNHDVHPVSAAKSFLETSL